MSNQANDDHVQLTLEGARHGLTGADILAVLAVSSFLAAIGLITFFAATAFGG